VKKVILHIGSGKTGSSSIQQALAECVNHNAPFFKSPKLLNFKGSQIFRFAFCPSADTPSNIKAKYKGQQDAYKAYQESIKSSFISEVENENTVIISSEFLFLSTKEEVLDIKKFLSELGFEEIHVIMYLRDPAKYYLSVAQQALKNQSKLPTPENFRYELISAISNWSAVDPVTMTVKEFERSKLKGADVVKDFESYVNDTLSISKAIINATNIQNETMCVEGAVILQEYHKVLARCSFDFETRQSYLRRARVFSNVANVGTKPVLKPDISAYIYNKYEEELKELHTKYGIFSQIKDTNPESALCKNNFTSFLDIVDSFDINRYLELKAKL